MFAPLIKWLVIAFLIVVTIISSIKKSEAWTPCMPLCDYLCTAPSALAMSLAVLSSHLELSKELVSNIDEISKLSQSLVDRNASINATETQNMSTKITAIDGFAFKTSAVLSQEAISNTILVDNYINQLDALSSSEISLNMAQAATKMMEKGMSDSFLTSLAAAPTIHRNSELMDDLRLVADQVQSSNNNSDLNEEEREVISLLTDITADIPNPFIYDSVDLNFNLDYQKMLTSLYNHSSGTPDSIHEKRRAFKVRLIIDFLNNHILQNGDLNGNGEIESLTMNTSATVARAKAEGYRRLMFEKDSLIAIENQTLETLMLTKVIVTSQKNLLLNEILKVKKQKNLMLALKAI